MYKDKMQNFIRLSGGVKGIMFMDSDGEAIEFAGSLPEYDLKIIGAHFSIFFCTVNGFERQPHSLFITMEPYVIGMYRLTKDYFLLVLYASSYHVIINKFRLRALINFIKDSI